MHILLKLKYLRNILRQKIIEPLSISATLDVANSNPELKTIWDCSFTVFPDFKNHFSVPVDNKEIEHRIRLLVVGETFFIKKEIEDILGNKKNCSYADIGDSDGSVRLLLNKLFFGEKLKSVGINLQQTAVNKMKALGLEAICADAITLGNQGINYDIISLFETLEHLPDPISFLKNIKPVTGEILVLSVPYIRKSRVNLAYLTEKWPKDRKPTIESVHIFELSTKDWEKIFLHTGWKIKNEWKLMAFPSNKLSRLILQPYWRCISFDGFWFVSLVKDNKYSSRYGVE